MLILSLTGSITFCSKHMACAQSCLMLEGLVIFHTHSRSLLKPRLVDSSRPYAGCEPRAIPMLKVNSSCWAVHSRLLPAQVGKKPACAGCKPGSPDGYFPAPGDPNVCVPVLGKNSRVQYASLGIPMVVFLSLQKKGCVMQDASPGIPMLVFLSPGVDVAAGVEALGRKRGFTADTGRYAIFVRMLVCVSNRSFIAFIKHTLCLHIEH